MGARRVKGLSVNLRWLFLDRPFLERIDIAARLGFRAVDFSLPYTHPAAEIRQRLDANGVGFVYMLSPSGNWDAGELGIAALPDRVAEFRDGMGLALDYAGALGCPLVHVAAGILPLDADPAVCRALYLENLAYAADRAARQNVAIGIEPICRASYPRFLVHRCEDAVALIEELGRPNLKLVFDTYHAAMEEGALTPLIEKHVARIAHFQVASPPARSEPGTGELDFDFLFGVLERVGFDGWLSAEYRPSRPGGESLTWARRFGVDPARA
jgi:hydroxypyruvate isomerase